jgi:hypothetical protein
MKRLRLLASIIVLFLLAGLFRAYRDGRFSSAQPGMQGSATASESPIDAPNRKVEPAGPVRPGRSRMQPRALGSTVGARGTSNLPVASSSTYTAPERRYVVPDRYGMPGPTEAPMWGRAGGKLPAAAPTYMPRNASIEPPHARFMSAPLPPAPEPPAPRQAIVAKSGRRAEPNSVAEEDYRVLLQHARFLIKAGLAPMAKDPLQRILRGAPGTEIARQARLTLDTIRN